MLYNKFHKRGCMRELLFSVTKKDLKIDFFSGTGAGGQHRNRNKNCVRIHHLDSGAIVTGQSYKSRKDNIREAFKNLVKNPKFKIWHSRKVNEIGENIEEKIDRMMEDIKIEFRKNGK